MAEPQKTIWLNDVEYPINGDVIWTRLSPFPSQIITGPATVQNYAPTTKHFVDNMKQGMGIEKWKGGLNDRYWYADGVDASRNTVTLGPLVTTMGTFGTEPVKIIGFAGKIWAIGNNSIAYWSGAAWVAANPTSTLASPTDALVFYESTE